MKDILDDPRCDITIPDQIRLMALAPSLDDQGYFPKEAFEIIADNNHFNLFVPGERGGLDYKLAHGMRIIEAYARIDGNLGWIVQIGAGGGVFSAYLEESVSYEFFGHKLQVIAGSDYVGGKATPTKGGYLVSGEWRYASGALHATAFTGNCRIMTGKDEGKVKAFIVQADQVTVLEDWNAMGMRASDSHSFRLDNVMVPENHTFVVDPDHLLIENKLLKLPFLLYARALFTPVLIGMAYHYHTLYHNLVLRKGFAPRTPPMDAGITFVEDWKEDREQLYKMVDQIWGKSGKDRVSPSIESTFAETCVHITDNIVYNIEFCHRHTGMEGIRMDSPINAIYRNIKTAAAHYLLSQNSL